MPENGGTIKQKANWRARALILGLIVVGFLAFVMITLGFVDWTPYRDRFEAVASEMLQRPVTIDGALSFRILPTPAFRAESVTIDTLPEGRAPFLARMDRLEMELALFPLLRGDIEVRKFELVRPLLNPERLPDGRLTGLLERFLQIAEENRAMRFDIITIKDGTLLIQDGVTNRSWRFDGINTRIRAESLSGPFRFDGSAYMDGLPLSLTLKAGHMETGRRTSLSARLDMGDGMIAATGWVQPSAESWRPDFSLAVEVDSPKLSLFLENGVRLMGTKEKDEALPDFVLWLDGSLALKADLSGHGADIHLEDLKGRYDGSPLRADGTVTFANGPRAALNLMIDHLALSTFARMGAYLDDPAPGPGLSLILPAFPSLPDGAFLDLTLEVGALSYGEGAASDMILKTQITPDKARLETFEVNLPGISRLSLMGDLLNVPEQGTGFQGHLTASSSSLRTLLAWLEIAHPVPEGRLSSLQLSTDILVRPGHLSLSALALTLDGSQASGDVILQQGSEKPTVIADLVVDRLNLDDYLPSRDPALPPVTIEDAARAVNIWLGARARLDGTLKLSIDRLHFLQHRLDGLSVALSQKDKGLVVERLNIESLDGLALTASGRLDHGDALPHFDVLFQTYIPNPAKFALMTGLATASVMTSDSDNASFGAATFDGRLSGDFSRTALDLVGTIADGRMTARGHWTSALADAVDKTVDTALDLALTYDHASQRVLGQRLGIKWLTQGDPLPLGLSLTVTGPPSQMALAGTARFLGGRYDLSGTMKMDGWRDAPSLSLALDVAHPSLAGLVHQLSPAYRLGNGDSGELKGTFALDYADGILAMDEIALALGQVAVTGRVDADFSADRPVLDVVMRSQGPSLLAMFSPAPADSGMGGADDAMAPRWSHKAMDMAALRAVDGRLRLSMADAGINGWAVTDLGVTARLEDGVLFLDHVDGRIFDGRLQLAATLDATAIPELALDFSLTDVAFGDVLAAGLGTRGVDGRATLVGTLSSRGRSPYAMVAALGGDIRLDIEDGAVKGFDFGILAAGVKDIRRPSDPDRLIAAFSSGEQSAFQQLSADIQVEEAVFTTETLKADMEMGTLIGQAKADLADWVLTAKAVLKLAGYQQTPPIALDLGGHLSRPVMALDTGPLRRWLLERTDTNTVPMPLAAPVERVPGAPEIVGSGSDESIKEIPPF